MRWSKSPLGEWIWALHSGLIDLSNKRPVSKEAEEARSIVVGVGEP